MSWNGADSGVSVYNTATFYNGQAPPPPRTMSAPKTKHVTDTLHAITYVFKQQHQQQTVSETGGQALTRCLPRSEQGRIWIIVPPTSSNVCCLVGDNLTSSVPAAL